MKYKTRRVVENHVIKWIKTPIEEEDAVTIEDDKDKEIARLKALVETLTKELSKLTLGLGEDVAVAPLSSYAMYG